jgi:hypothetical protein
MHTTPHLASHMTARVTAAVLAVSCAGNCLLHAASVGLWGVHDRGARQSLGTLRSALHQAMISHKDVFFDRWQRQVGLPPHLSLPKRLPPHVFVVLVGLATSKAGWLAGCIRR